MHLLGIAEKEDQSAGTGATQYQLWLGSTGAGSQDLASTGPTTALSITRTNMPTTGKTIYARLFTNFSGVWVYTEYTYTAE